MGFMAPEQFQGRALPATDVYAVGATALALLAGADPDTLPHQGLRVDVRGALGQRVSPTMIASLEQMMEPDPDRRAQSLGQALDDVRKSTSQRPPPIVSSLPPPMPPMPPVPQPHPAAIYRPAPPGEDTIRSIRRLLWTLWGLGWVLVPVTFSEIGLKRGIPGVMFGSLALILVLTWHKGAAIRAILEMLGVKAAQRVAPQHPSVPPAGVAGPPVRARIDVGPAAQVRVHTTEMQADELGQTERTSTRTEVAAPQRARRL
jgi:hypothetical protein